MVLFTIHTREPLRQWKYKEHMDCTFERAAKRCWDLLVVNGGDAVEARFCRTSLLTQNWTYIPQFTDLIATLRASALMPAQL